MINTNLADIQILYKVIITINGNNMKMLNFYGNFIKLILNDEIAA